jgi:hypothetical protein
VKITVAVPTVAGRSKYLAACLATCTSQDEDFEILVSDNSDGASRELVQSIADRRMRYVSPPKYLPMSAHWDFVLTQITGDRVCIIGDDDGLMPGCIRRVREIHAEVGDLPIHHAFATYRWPDFLDEAARNTVLFVHDVDVGGTIIASRDFLCGVATGARSYVDGPMVYHNFIPARLLKRLSGDGVVFRRASPDVYSALAVAANVDEFFHSNELLTLSGQGAKANGAAVVRGHGQEFLAEMEQLYKPRFGHRSVQLQVLDSLIEVAEHFDRPELLASIRYDRHVAGAIAESIRMSRGVRSFEMRQALALAAREGVISEALGQLAGRASGKLARRAGIRRTTARHLFAGGEVMSLGKEVENIFDAALAISRLVAAPRRTA